jgi:hypothetical protein
MRRPEVFDATIVCAGTIFSSFANRLCFGSSFSMIASITRSHSLAFERSSSTLPVETSCANEGWKNAAGRDFSAFSRPPAAKRSRFFLSRFSSSLRFGGTMSRRSTRIPALARWAAMPLPMTPLPITQTFRIGVVME